MKFCSGGPNLKNVWLKKVFGLDLWDFARSSELNRSFSFLSFFLHDIQQNPWHELEWGELVLNSPYVKKRKNAIKLTRQASWNSSPVGLFDKYISYVWARMHNRCKTKCNPVHVGKQKRNLRLCKTNFIQWYIDIYVFIYEEWQTQTWQTSAGENSACHIKKIPIISNS